ncbi:MAG: CinA family protein [Gammaproteobacteria bacterium]|nr:CinA family protein [Gammaproteobacteria bacterium]MBQ0838446.1 CinA family protein [Gammaproteobacteria bacterium]
MNSLVTLGQPVGELLKQNEQTLAVCESSIAGLLSAALVSVPGASAYFLGSTVVYTLESRRQFLNMSDEAMKGVRSATEEYALLCARSIHQTLGGTWALAETGATGPASNPYKDPPGTAWFAVTGPVEKTLQINTGHNRREENMWQFAEAALALLAQCIGEANAADNKP